MAFAKSSGVKRARGVVSFMGSCRLVSLLAASAVLAACTALPTPPEVPVTYDFGALSGSAAAVTVGDARPALVLVGVTSSGIAGDSQAIHYRQAFAVDQRLHAYQLARWSQSPSQLFEQQLRSELQVTRPVIGEDLRLSRTRSGTDSPAVLQIDLLSFEQIFESNSASAGHVQVQATLLQSNVDGNSLLGQKIFSVKSPATSANAVGGAQAMAQASKNIAQQINEWVGSLGK